MFFQPLPENDRSSDHIHLLFAARAGNTAFDKGVLSGNGGKALILKYHLQAGFFKLAAEISDFLCLESFRSIHIQRQTGQNTVGIIALADGKDLFGIRSPSHALYNFDGTGDCSCRIGDRHTDPYIADIQAYNSLIHNPLKRSVPPAAEPDRRHSCYQS